jgi:hypothetical protein
MRPTQFAAVALCAMTHLMLFLPQSCFALPAWLGFAEAWDRTVSTGAGTAAPGPYPGRTGHWGGFQLRSGVSSDPEFV